MKTWKPILLLLAVFLAGIFIGVAGTRFVVRRSVQQAIIHPERAQWFVERDLAKRLHLNKQQQTKIRAILTDTRTQLQALRKEYQPQAQSLLIKADAQITPLLNPQQLKRYDRLKHNNRQLWRALQNQSNAQTNSAAR